MNLGFLANLAGIKWKIFTGLAGLSFAAAAFFLLMAQMENRHLRKVNVQLEARINAPDIGYAAQLAQATTNVETLKLALDTQNVRLREQALASGTKLAELTTQIDRIRRENEKLRSDSAKILKGKPEGDTLAARVTDIDNRLLETLK